MVSKKVLMGFLVVLSVFVFACSSQDDANGLVEADNQEVLDDVVNDVVDDVVDLDDSEDYVPEFDVKYFYVEGGPMFEFFVDGVRNADIVVNVGDVVIIEFESVGGMPHDFVIDEFEGASTQVWQPGEGETIEFVADRVGTFEYYCSVGQHRERGMVGNLIVQ